MVTAWHPIRNIGLSWTHGTHTCPLVLTALHGIALRNVGLLLQELFFNPSADAKSKKTYPKRLLEKTPRAVLLTRTRSAVMHPNLSENEAEFWKPLRGAPIPHLSSDDDESME